MMMGLNGSFLENIVLTLGSWGLPRGLNGTLFCRVFAYARPYMRKIILAACFALLYSIFQLVQLAVLKKTVDIAVSDTAATVVMQYAGLFVICVFIGIIADAFHKYLMTVTGQSITVDIQNEVHRHLHTLDDEYFKGHSPGDLTHQMFHDASTTQQIVGLVFSSLVRYPLTLFVVGVYMLWLDPLFAIVAIIGLIMVMAVTSYTTRGMQRPARQLSEQLSRINHRFLTLLEARHLIRVYDKTGLELNRLPYENSIFLQQARAFVLKKSILQPLSYLLASVITVCLICWGGYRLRGGQMSPGGATALLAALLTLYRPLSGMSRILTTVRESFASSERIFELLDTPPYWNAKHASHKLDGAVESLKMIGCSFSYPDRDFSLHGIDLELKAGTLTALCGQTGSGKSTLRKLLCGVLQPDNGMVAVNGIPIDMVSQQSFGEQLVYVPQRCPTIGDTLREEIALSDSFVTDSDLQRIAVQAQLSDWIASLPDGWDTRIGPGGIAVSGGERQRLAIARLLLHPRPVTILDEATSELDIETESRILSVVSQHIRKINGIGFFISHRLNIRNHVDRILTLNNGTLSESSA